MSVVGKAVKQPQEVESYSVVYGDDFSTNESLTSAYHSITNRSNLLGRTVLTGTSYTPVLADSMYLFVCPTTSAFTFTITSALFPVGAELYVSNRDNLSVTINCAELIDGAASLVLAPSHSVILVRAAANTWTAEASAMDIMIAAGSDQRVRVFFTGGAAGKKYKAEVTATTTDGRTLQDEIQVTVKEF